MSLKLVLGFLELKLSLLALCNLNFELRNQCVFLLDSLLAGVLFEVVTEAVDELSLVLKLLVQASRVQFWVEFSLELGLCLQSHLQII